VETTNISECVEPLVAMIMDLNETGAHTAKVCWDAMAGFVIIIQIMACYCAGRRPVMGFGLPRGVALPAYLEHYLFSCDKQFLAKTYL